MMPHCSMLSMTDSVALCAFCTQVFTAPAVCLDTSLNSDGVKNEVVANHTLSRCYCTMILFCVHNLISFNKKPRQSLHRAPQMAAHIHYLTFLLTTCIHTDDNLNKKFKMWTQHSTRPVAADFQSTSCVI